MNKIKKIFSIFSLFLIGGVNKVFASRIDSQQELYGVRNPQTSLYEENLSMGKIILPIFLFIIGLFVFFNKKLSKKAKAILLSILLLISIIGFLIFHFIL